MKYLFALALVVLALQCDSVLGRRTSKDSESSSFNRSSSDDSKTSGVKSLSDSSSDSGSQRVISPSPNERRPVLTLDPVQRSSAPLATHPLKNSSTKTHPETPPRRRKRWITTYGIHDRCNKDPFNRFTCSNTVSKYFYNKNTRQCYRGAGCGKYITENIFNHLHECARQCMGM